MPDCRVSVVIPAYNQAGYLAEAIDSVLAQTYRGVEIIVVDDGSTDDTAEVVHRYGDAVRYLYQENQGLAGARNTGILQATGDYVALLDSDDLWLPSFLDEMMALAEHQPAAGYYCGVYCMAADGKALPQRLCARPVAAGDLYQVLLRANPIIPSTVVLHRSTAIKAGLFDPEFRRLQDWEFWLRLLRDGHQFIGLGKCLARYRLHDSSLSTDPAGGAKAALALAEKHFGPETGKPETWSADKQRAYGGAYRAGALTILTRQQDWQACGDYLHLAFQADPTLAESLDLFYELALGSQPLGQRGEAGSLPIRTNADQIEHLLGRIFQPDPRRDLSKDRQIATHTAYWALSLAAYNTRQFGLARAFLWKSLRFSSAQRRGQALRMFVKSSLFQFRFHWQRRFRAASTSST